MKLCLRLFSAVAVTALLASPTPTLGQMYINEIFFDPGGAANDQRDEFIELRGEAGTSLDDHYLVFLENELDAFGDGDAGVVENLFELGGFSIGSNGFLVLLQKFNTYSADNLVAGANILTNDGPNRPGSFPAAFPGYGNNAEEGSTIGASDLPSPSSEVSTGATENSGFTAMLIRNDSGAAPMLGEDLDIGNDGLDVPTGKAGWTVLDSIGVFGEADETEFGRLYGRANFGSGVEGFFPPGWTPNIEPGADFELVPYEIEHIARWGNSTGSTGDDWHITNLTDNEGSGSLGVSRSGMRMDLRQSLVGGHPSDDGNSATPAPAQAAVESNKAVPYGTKLLDNIGGPNYLTGDFNNDGYVDIADYTVWRDTAGETEPTGLFPASETDHPLADHNHDFDVDQDDYDLWEANFGLPGSLSGGGAAVPEPASAVLLMLMGACVRNGRR
ncbi:MAG: hypothetical protein AAFV43_03385 [Planctomycetota bacterium]